MAKAYVFLATGFEAIEAVAPTDILRQGGVDVKFVSVTGNIEVKSNIGITIHADALFEDCGDFADADVLMMPGGMPGAQNLSNHEGLVKAVRRQYERGKLVAGVCAGPWVLGKAGVLNGKTATCYPGFEQYMTGANITGRLVERDGNVITGNSCMAAMPYGFLLLNILTDKATEDLWVGYMHYDQLIKEA